MRLSILFELQQMSSLELLLLTLFLLVGFFIAGFVLDAILQKDGFGPYWNGLVAMLGVALGLSIRSRFFALTSPYDPAFTMAIVLGTLVAMLMLLSAVRNRLA